MIYHCSLLTLKIKIMKKIILISLVALISILASCASKKNCVCLDSAGKEISNQVLNTNAENECAAQNVGATFAGGKCELK